MPASRSRAPRWSRHNSTARKMEGPGAGQEHARSGQFPQSPGHQQTVLEWFTEYVRACVEAKSAGDVALMRSLCDTGLAFSAELLQPLLAGPGGEQRELPQGEVSALLDNVGTCLLLTGDCAWMGAGVCALRCAKYYADFVRLVGNAGSQGPGERLPVLIRVLRERPEMWILLPPTGAGAVRNPAGAKPCWWGACDQPMAARACLHSWFREVLTSDTLFTWTPTEPACVHARGGMRRRTSRRRWSAARRRSGSCRRSCRRGAAQSRRSACSAQCSQALAERRSAASLKRFSTQRRMGRCDSRLCGAPAQVCWAQNPC